MYVTMNGNKIIIDGKSIEAPKSKFFNSVVIVDGKIYANCREYKNGKWKITLTAIFYTLFC